MKVIKSKKQWLWTVTALAASGLVSQALAADGTWTTLTPNFGGTGATDPNWGQATNWQGGIVADGVGSTATFSQNWTGSPARPAISISNAAGTAANFTVGTWNVVDTNTATGTYFEVGGSGTLTLDNGANKPVINVTGIGIFQNGTAKFIGTNGFRLTGNGDHDLRSDSSGLSGTVVVEGGRVRMFGNRNALGVGDLDMRSGTSIYFAVGGGAINYSTRSFSLSGEGPVDGGVLRIGNNAAFTIKDLTINGTGTPNNRTVVNFDSNGNSVTVTGTFGGTGEFRIGSRGGYIFANNGATYTGATVLENGALISKGTLATSSISIAGTGDTAAVIGWETGGTVTLGGAGTTVTTAAAGAGAVRASGAGTKVVLSPGLNTSLYVHNGATIDAGTGTYDLQPASRLMGSGTIKVGTINIYEDTPVYVSNDRITNTNNAGTLTIQGNANIGNVFGGSGYAGIAFDLSGVATDANSDKLVVTGNTVITSGGGAMPITIGARSGFLDDADYTLIESGTVTGGATYALSLPAVVANQRTTYAVSDNTVANKVVLKATGTAASLKWDGPAASKTWDIKTTSNFKNGVTADKFYTADDVTFDDTATTKSVQLVEASGLAGVLFTPSAMTLSNTAAGGAYTFTNSAAVSGTTVTLTGNIGGDFPINKTGDGDVNWNFNISGNYRGNLNINAGNFIVNSTEVYATTTPAALGVALGNAKINIGANGTLINRNTVDASMGNTVTGTGTIRLQNTGNFNLNTADNSGFSGPIFVQNGRTLVNLPVSLGSGPITIDAPVGQSTSPTLYTNFSVVGSSTVANNINIAGQGRFGNEGALRIGGTQGATFTGIVTMTADAAIGVDALPTTISNSLVGPGGLIKRGGGTLNIANANYGGGTSLEAGKVVYTTSATTGGAMVIGAGTTVAGGVSVALPSSTSAASPKVLKATNLTINAPATATNPANTLDIGNNAVVLDYASTSPLAAVKTAILAGLDGAQAGEAAIITSDTTAGRSIGYAEASAITVSPVFGTVDATTLLIRHTVNGDTNLDGVTNFDDLLALAQNYNGTGKEWYQGDVAKYDGNVDFDDLLVLAQSYNGALTLSESASLGSDFAADFALAQSLVPEPTSLMGLIGLVALRRSRK